MRKTCFFVLLALGGCAPTAMLNVDELRQVAAADLTCTHEALKVAAIGKSHAAVSGCGMREVFSRSDRGWIVVAKGVDLAAGDPPPPLPIDAFSSFSSPAPVLPPPPILMP